MSAVPIPTGSSAICVPLLNTWSRCLPRETTSRYDVSDAVTWSAFNQPVLPFGCTGSSTCHHPDSLAWTRKTRLTPFSFGLASVEEGWVSVGAL